MSCHHHSRGKNVPSAAAGDYAEQNYGPGAKWVKNLTRDRLNNFTGGHFGDVNLSSVMFSQRQDSTDFVKLKVWSAPGRTKPSFEEAMQQKFRTAKKTNHWWHVTIHVPKDWSHYERAQFEFDPGCEAMVYSLDGTPLQGITGGHGGDRRVDYIIPPEAREAGTHEIIIESSCNGMFGVPWNGDTIAPPDMNRYFRLDSADLVVPNQEAWRLYWDFEALKQVIDTLPGNTILQNKALVAANEIVNVFGRGDASGIKNARKLAEEVFGHGWEKKGADIYKEGPKRATIWGIGHCHIDSAWLWPYSVTQQKVARSWSTQVDLMERYPEHRFACSSAQQYKWLETLYPALFENVKKKVLEGKFHPVGGSWVENDGNMPSGEALVRQVVFGQRFFETRFGIRCETGWLPDSFGLTGAYPQIFRLAGMKYFFTQKLSWNNINKFPHSSFNWVGIDGTQVLCHMTPVETYTAQATVGDVNKGVTNHKNLESSDTALLVFGNGDGGGGPLSKMFENLRRIRAVTNEHRELPPVDMGHSVDEFFADLESTTNEGKTLPNWHGELYLEFHRGTYTSHGSIKKGNRHSEILMRDIELVATLASLSPHHKNSYVYPKTDIDNNWEKLLLNQFHDVLPGSSIGMVYDDAEKLYHEIKQDGEAILEEALSILFPNSMPLTPNTRSKALGGSAKVVALNTTFFPRLDIVQVPLSTSSGSGWGSKSAVQEIRQQVMQTSEDGKVGWGVMQCTRGGGGVGELVAPSNELRSRLKPVSVYTNGSDHFVLRNSSVQLTISEGRITSLLDVAQDRELISAGQTGGLVIFEDRPNYWDAWDVEIHHLEVQKELKFSNIAVVAQGPLFAGVRAEVKYGQSTIVITISLSATTATVRDDSRSFFNFDAVVDWRQRHEFLKFQLPLNIHSQTANYETSFGHVQRPTHKNTSWDIAKFEVCGHKYADLSEFGYGVAILSESKYGFSCLGNVLSISLLRAATAPDAEQDQGTHQFSWAVYPHEGHFLESDVPTAGYLYNSPIRARVVPPGSPDLLNALEPIFDLSGARNVFLETVKRGEYDSFKSPASYTSEDDEDDGLKKDKTTTIVLRLYEAYGGHASLNLKIGHHLPVVKAYETNLLEDSDDSNELRIHSVEKRGSGYTSADGGSNNAHFDKSIKLNFRGFEIKTVVLVLGTPKRSSSPQSPHQKPLKRSSWVNVDQNRLFD
ncbi:alpha-mannosidase [Coprinopsis sp. MPI-PUGE-AT-0042]|nr:alpha-mannosidase [Coprinopsis sp. MPI-PUGE-AT-0042]